MNGKNNKSPATQSSDKGSRVDTRHDIIGYLRAHPEAADTVEGIIDWWLPLQRYENSKNEIQQALLDLVKRGVIEEIVLGNSNRLYRLYSGRGKQVKRF